MLYGNMHIRINHEASRLIREEPERFFMPEGNGMVTKQQYLDIVGLPYTYEPKIKLNSFHGHSQYNPVQNVYFFDKRQEKQGKLILEESKWK